MGAGGAFILGLVLLLLAFLLPVPHAVYLVLILGAVGLFVYAAYLLFTGGPRYIIRRR